LIYCLCIPACIDEYNLLQSALLDELAMSEKRFRHVLQANIELLSEGVVPGVIQLFEGFAGLSYLLSEEQYSQYQINDPFMQGFISNMHAKLAPHKVGHLTRI
jgi:hypothetical protein